MTSTKSQPKLPSDVAIFVRLLENGRGAMSTALARYLLKLGFDENDQSRMADLATRNQAGELSEEEREELTGFVHAGHMLALLQSKARRVLRSKARV